MHLYTWIIILNLIIYLQNCKKNIKIENEDEVLKEKGTNFCQIILKAYMMLFLMHDFCVQKFFRIIIFLILFWDIKLKLLKEDFIN